MQLLGERWKARCRAGAGVGDTLVIEAVEQITLVVSKPGSDLAQGPEPPTYNHCAVRLRTR